MKNQTLKEFYYGNLIPCERRMVRDSEVTRIVKELSDSEAELSRSLLPELQPVLDRFAKAQNDLDSIMAETSYIDGFKTGARFMMEILDDARENLKPITE